MASPRDCRHPGARPSLYSKRRPLPPRPPTAPLCVSPAPLTEFAAAAPPRPGTSPALLYSADVRSRRAAMRASATGRWDTQLLYEEREEHRVSMDRAYQSAARWRARAEVERAAHRATRAALFSAQAGVLAAQEAVERRDVVTKELEARIAMALLWAQTQRACFHGAESVKGFENSRRRGVGGRGVLIAHDSDLLRALQRAEARIACLEDQMWEDETGRYTPLSSNICTVRY